MAVPSSQVIAAWIKQDLQDPDWISLRDISAQTIKKYWNGVSDAQLYELVEQNLPYIAEHLRDDAAEWMVDGAIPVYEIDNEPTPYVRTLKNPGRAILQKLRKIDPFKLEEVCSLILNSLGAEAHVTQRTNDGGIDFIAVRLKIVPIGLPVPIACMAAVIGQTKRYKETNVIKEVSVREFVGAATLRRYELQVDKRLGPLAPVLYAFWTTSEFDPNAKKFCRAAGLWYMDGRTLANYIEGLGLGGQIWNFRTQTHDCKY